jgi:hypothetical protein
MEDKRHIPRFEDEDAEREFWTWHDSTDYVDWRRAQRLRLPTLSPQLRAGLSEEEPR